MNTNNNEMNNEVVNEEFDVQDTIPNKDDSQQTDELTIEEQLAKAQEKIDELNDKYLRQIAEFDNYRKRVIKEKAELIKNGGEKIITSILPILDDFDRAESNMEKMEDLDSLKEGVRLIIEKFSKLLKQEGLEKMDVVGKDFDTDFHEAIAMVPGQPDEMRGKIIDCVMAGYTLNDKVVRHAKVAVAE